MLNSILKYYIIPLYVGIYTLFSSNMWDKIGFVILWVLLGILVWRLIATIYFMWKKTAMRKQSVQQSKAVTLWYVSEKIAPLLPNFPYSYKDLVFLGKWVDYICFDGLSTGDMKQIIFLEIKTGKSQLNKNEAIIKSVIEKRRVKRETVRI